MARLPSLEQALKQRGVTPPHAQTLQTALTHRSAGKDNYERIEFLGDALVNMVCAELLFRTQVGASEGELTRMRANLVDEASLAVFARELNLSDHLILGSGELKSGGYRRDSILADTFEALCGAIYLDHGLPAMRTLLEPMLTAAMPVAIEKARSKDAKTQLQEWLQDRAMGLPVYVLIETFGLDHNREFLVHCDIAATVKFAAATSSGRGSSLRRAEQAAAMTMLQTLRTRIQVKLPNHSTLQNLDQKI